MKNLTKKTMILGLMAAFLFPFSAIAQRGNGGGNNGNRVGNTTQRHKPKPTHQKQKPNYRYYQHRKPYGYRPAYTHRRPQHRTYTQHRPRYRNYNYRGPRYGRQNYRPIGMHVIVYNNLHESLNRTSFDRDRLAIAKLAIANNGVNTDQVINLMNKLCFDDNRLELSKYAFDFVIDPSQYFRVAENLVFFSNRRDLLNYIQ